MAKKTGGFSILRNRATLYSVFFLSVVYLFFLLLNFDFPAVFFFGLVGLVTSFFTRNMIIVLFISLVITIIVKLGGILGDPDIPSPYPPVSESTTTTEIILYDENGNMIRQNNEVEIDVVVPRPVHPRDADMEIMKMVVEDTPNTNEVLMIPGYQSSIMLSKDAPNFDNPIELIPIDMRESSYGYELSNPFSKFDQNCSVSDKYSCF
jgi:hypothetical protein